MQISQTKPTIENKYLKNNIIAIAKPQSVNKQKTLSLSNTLDLMAKQNIAFMSKKEYEDDLTAFPEFDRRMTGFERGESSYYLRNFPEKFYFKNNKNINKFLRTGELSPVDDPKKYNMGDLYKDAIKQVIGKDQDYNLSIVESIEILDSMMTSKTDDVMVLHTNIPKDWKNKKEGDIVGERGYFEAVEKKKLSSEVEKGYEDAVEVIIPKGMPYMEIDIKGEPIMLFPRGMKYQILDENSIEMLGR